jgi:hypothetical protein
MTDNTQTSSASAQSETFTDFELMFGAPALLKGERRGAYDLLRATIACLLPTRYFLDELRVQEVTDSIWEGRRFARFATQLIDTGQLMALEVLLQPVCKTNSSNIPALIAMHYFYGDTEKRQAAKKLVSSAGITDDHIQAQALLVNAGQFSYFDRLTANRSATLKGLVKDYERQKRKAEKRDEKLLQAAAARQRGAAPVNDNSAAAKKDAA